MTGVAVYVIPDFEHKPWTADMYQAVITALYCPECSGRGFSGTNTGGVVDCDECGGSGNRFTDDIGPDFHDALVELRHQLDEWLGRAF